VKRGEIWTASGGKDYASKPRPVVIVQDDRFDATDSITVCAFTTDQTDAPLLRLVVIPSAENGLRASCSLMVDKITTVPKSKIGHLIGRIDDADLARLNLALLVYLGLATAPKRPLRVLKDGLSVGPSGAQDMA
jgi:mRNA interferase MazF